VQDADHARHVACRICVSLARGQGDGDAISKRIFTAGTIQVYS
jgi:hypothetical protein